jgi:hypothetical protein
MRARDVFDIERIVSTRFHMFERTYFNVSKT